jgi:hypothetical protein
MSVVHTLFSNLVPTLLCFLMYVPYCFLYWTCFIYIFSIHTPLYVSYNYLYHIFYFFISICMSVGALYTLGDHVTVDGVFIIYSLGWSICMSVLNWSRHCLLNILYVYVKLTFKIFIELDGLRYKKIAIKKWFDLRQKVIGFF